MIRLFRAELVRARSRRLVRVFAMLSIVGAVGIGALTFAQSSSADGAAIAVKVKAAKATEAHQQQALVDCLYKQSHGDGPSATRCEQPAPPHVRDPRFYRARVQAYLKGAIGVIALVAWLIGASLVGAEFQSRAMTTTLTFAPRRIRVFAVKAAAALTVVCAWALMTMTAVLVALLPAAILHAGPAIAQPGNWTIAGAFLRGGILAAVMAGIGFSIASFGRNTAAALGFGFAYLIVLENIVGTAIAGWRPWLLLGNVLVFLSGDNSGVDVIGRSVIGAGIFLVGIAAVMLVVSGATFWRRDIA